MLEIGCGWGGLACYAAEHYGVEVVGITISKEQQKLARVRCEGLPVSIELMDYRDLTEPFDKIVSVGMFEHVGPKNHAAYFDTAHRVLKDDGLFLLHIYRMWKYYLMSCAGFFRSRQGQLWQLVLSKPERGSVERSVR